MSTLALPSVLFGSLFEKESTKSERPLASDTRGAAMMVGVFMACFLIGTLWFMIGVGNAVVWRGQAQEASDAAVFSSAAIHAKGMNIISFLNGLMLAIVFIYLLIAIIVDIILFITGLAIAGIITIVSVPALVAAAKNVDNVAKIYKVGMKFALPTFAAVQTGVAYLAPWGGTIAAGSVSKNYGFLTIAVGPSNIPGTDGSVRTLLSKVPGVSKVIPGGGGGLAAFDAATKKLGLPVESKKMNYLCQVAVAFVMEKLFSLLGGIPLVGRFLGKIRNFVSGFLGTGISEIHCREPGSQGSFDPASLYDKKPPGGLLARGIKALIKAATAAVGTLAGFAFSVYKDEDWWGDKYGGPKAIYATQNGREWNYIYGYTPAKYEDKEGGKIKVASIRGGTFLAKPSGSGIGGLGMHMYTAQSEFYFDCDEKWKGTKCNGDDLYDYTMYSMRWRARIIRYRGFGLNTLGRLFGDFVGKFLTTNKMTNFFIDKLGPIANKIPDTGVGGFIKDILVGKGQNNYESQFTKAIKAVVAKAKGAVVPLQAGTTSLH